MKRLFLFPSKFRIIGLIILIPAIVYFVAINHFNFGFSFLKFPQKNEQLNEQFLTQSFGDYNPTVAYAIILIALILIAFSKMKIEDEMIAFLRLQAFQIAVYISLLLLLILDFTAYGLAYVLHSTFLWYIFLVLFIVIFYTKIYLTDKSAQNEK